jgi:hypothetical protein
MLGRFIKVGALAAGLVAVAGTPAFADGGSAGGTGLPWHSPHEIVSGVPVSVASITSCPAVPTPGDQVLVGITLSFGPGASSGQILPANPDGSWAGNVTFGFSVPGLRHATISASCLDFNGITGVPYATYVVHHTQISS